jgi:hypothetical protein
MTSLTGRTLALLRRQGYRAAVVERWVPGCNIRCDLFGCAGVLAVHPEGRAFLLVQCTSLAHVGDRLRKARARPELAAWLKAGGGFEVWGWGRRGNRWAVKVVAVRAEDLAAVVVEAPPRRPGGRKWYALPLFDSDAASPPEDARQGKAAT